MINLSKVDENETCNYYIRSNQTFIATGCGFIPENFLLNLVTWALLLFVFALLRKRAWNYGRLALVRKSEQRWTQLFFAEVHNDTTTTATAAAATTTATTNEKELPDVQIESDTEFCSWIYQIFTLSDDQILHRCGLDAVHYLSFQRHLIFCLTIICCICLIVILPVNFLQGKLLDKELLFGRTTISNLNGDSNYLWFHVVCSFGLLPLIVFVMRRFSLNIRVDMDKISQTSRTLMITHVPKESCLKNIIVHHFSEAYPSFEIVDIQFAYTLSKLISLDKKKEAVTEYRLWCEAKLNEENERPLMYSNRFGNLACNRCEKIDAIDYYTRKETKLMNELEKERETALLNPLGIVFVTFDTENAAYQVYNDHKTSCKCSTNPPTSSLSRRLETYAWGVQFAPPPEDIYWEHLSSDVDNWYIRAIFINTAVFLFLFFFTTPVYILQWLNLQKFIEKFDTITPFASDFAPTLLILVIAALLPVLVRRSDELLQHWSRSSENHSIMRKSFIFLLFMVLILPSLGFTSANVFFKWTLKQNSTLGYQWQCIFLPDNGAFFVNYVITSALIGTAIEIIRLPDLILYATRKIFARSPAERAYVDKNIVWEFPFGMQYARMLLHFSTTIIYSILCPIIAPFGLLYMCLRHCVDRYNIYFAYRPSKINQNIHVTAMNFVVATVILLQVVILFFLIIRRGDEKIPSAIVWVTMISCIVSTILYIAHVLFKNFRFFSPIMYKRFQEDERSRTESDTRQVIAKFLAPVLRPHKEDEHENKNESGPNYRGGRRSYGTSGADSPLTDTSSVSEQNLNYSSTSELISYQ